MEACLDQQLAEIAQAMFVEGCVAESASLWKNILKAFVKYQHDLAS